jgi:hypothetical protein
MSFAKLGIVFQILPDLDQDVDHLHLGVQDIRKCAAQFLFDGIHHPDPMIARRNTKEL